MIRFIPVAVLVALAPALGGCPSAQQTQVLDTAISLTAAGFCSVELKSPPANPGPITKSTYAAVVSSCGTLPTDEASAETFIVPVISAYLTAKLAGN